MLAAFRLGWLLLACHLFVHSLVPNRAGVSQGLQYIRVGAASGIRHGLVKLPVFSLARWSVISLFQPEEWASCDVSGNGLTGTAADDNLLSYWRLAIMCLFVCVECTVQDANCTPFYRKCVLASTLSCCVTHVLSEVFCGPQIQV